VTALVPGDARHCGLAVEKRDLELVARADAAVVVWCARDAGVRRFLALVEARGIPVHVVSAPVPGVKARHARDEEPRRPRGMLPD